MGCGASQLAREPRPLPESRKGWEEDPKVVSGPEVSIPFQDESEASRDPASSGVGWKGMAWNSCPVTEHHRINADPAIGRLISKPQPLQRWERQTSSDILEELIVQGIIQGRSQASRNRGAEDVTGNNMEEPLRKPPAKLKKLKAEKQDHSSAVSVLEKEMKGAEERWKVTP
uniref:Stathmin domain containing 1 n=2 Tax=Ornithorhynchus anatinus TaxID=9258 RepID=A0A6I8NIC7_ORNAN